MRTALMIGSIGSFFNLYQQQALFPQLVGRFGTTVTEAGWLNMASLLGMMITAPIAGAATKNSNPSTVLIFGFLALAALNVSIALTTSQYLLFALRIGQGVVIPFLLTSTMSLVSTRPESFVPLYVTGTIVGSTFSRLYPAWSADAMGWELGFLSSACLMALSALAIRLLLNASGTEPASRLERYQTPVAHVKHAFSDRTLYLACLPALFFVLSARFVRRYMTEAMIAASLILLVWVSLWIIGVTDISIIIGVVLFATGTYMFQTVTTQLLNNSRLVPAGVATGIYLSCYYLGGAIGASLAAYVFAAWAWSGVIVCIAMTQTFIFCLVLFVRYGSTATFESGNCG